MQIFVILNISYPIYKSFILMNKKKTMTLNSIYFILMDGKINYKCLGFIHLEFKIYLVLDINDMINT